MSKITAKNLQYNTSLPPFLARLRGEAVSDPNGPDPILAAQRRPTKKRSGSAEAEDAPLVVDERGNVVDVSIGVDGAVKEQEVAAETKPGEAQEEDGTGDAPSAATGAEKIAGVGDGALQRRKRKVAKVVGADADEHDDDGHTDGGRKKGRTETNGAKKQENPAPTAKPKGKKKAKKIKLSFGDDEG